MTDIATSTRRFEERAPSLFPPVPYYVKLEKEWDEVIPRELSRLSPTQRVTFARAWVEPMLYATFEHETRDCGFMDMMVSGGEHFGPLFDGKRPELLLRRKIRGRGFKAARAWRGGKDLPNFSELIYQAVMKYQKAGTPIISFRRASQLLVQWQDNVQQYDFSRTIAMGPENYDRNPVYLGTVIPLYAAEVLDFIPEIQGAQTLSQRIMKRIKDAYDLDCGIYPRDNLVLSGWPVVLTMDRQLTPLQDGDSVADMFGNIIFQMKRAETHVTMDGELRSVDFQCRLYDPVRKRALPAERNAVFLANGWPNSPLSAVINKVVPEASAKNRCLQAAAAFNAYGVALPR